MSFNIGPQCIGLINAWLSHAGSKHNCILPFALGTNTKLLHHSAVSSTPSGIMMSSSCSCWSSSLNGFCSAYAMHLRGTWYDLLSGLSCKENMPSKHPILLNTSPYVSYILCVMAAILLCLCLYYLRKRSNWLICLFGVVDCCHLVWLCYVHPCLCSPQYHHVFPALCLFCSPLSPSQVFQAMSDHSLELQNTFLFKIFEFDSGHAHAQFFYLHPIVCF